MKVIIIVKGGPGSGFEGHQGRPGEVGGSARGNIGRISERGDTYKDAAGTKIYVVHRGQNLPKDLIDDIGKLEDPFVRFAFNSVTGNWHISSKSLHDSDHGDFFLQSLEGERPEYVENIQARGVYDFNANEITLYDFTNEVPGIVSGDAMAEKRLLRALREIEQAVRSGYFYKNGRKPKILSEDFGIIAGDI